MVPNIQQNFYVAEQGEFDDLPTLRPGGDTGPTEGKNQRPLGVQRWGILGGHSNENSSNGGNVSAPYDKQHSKQNSKSQGSTEDIFEELAKKDNIEAVKAFIPEKTHPDYKNKVKIALLLASKNQRLGCVEYIVDKCDCDVNCCTSKDKVTPLHYAAFSGNAYMAKILLQRGSSMTNLD